MAADEPTWLTLNMYLHEQPAKMNAGRGKNSSVSLLESKLSPW